MPGEPKDACAVCGKARDNHNYRHSFVDPDTPQVLSFRENAPIDDNARTRGTPQGSVRIPTAGDPILRMALIRAGVIKVEDLDAIEAELRVTGVAGYEPPTPLG